MSSQTCQLCGQHDDDVRVQLAWFRQKAFGPTAAIKRCLDHAACRARVEQGGDPWPLATTFDEVDRPLPFVEPGPAPAVEPEPAPEPEEATSSWFS